MRRRTKRRLLWRNRVYWMRFGLAKKVGGRSNLVAKINYNVLAPDFFFTARLQHLPIISTFFKTQISSTDKFVNFLALGYKHDLAVFTNQMFLTQTFCFYPDIRVKSTPFSLLILHYAEIIHRIYFELVDHKGNKRFKASSALKRAREYFKLTGAQEVGYINRLRLHKVRRHNARLQMVERHVDISRRFNVCEKKRMRKYKILFDRLFLWAYRQKKIRYTFGRRSSKIWGLPHIV